MAESNRIQLDSSELIDHVLGEGAYAHVHRCLAQGDLVAACLRGIDLTTTEILAPLPSGLSETAIMSFGSGGTGAFSAIRSLMRRLVDDHLAQGPEHCVVFETIARPRDPRISTRPAYLFFAMDRVYSFATGDPAAPPEQGKHALVSARAYPMVGVFSTVPPSLGVLQRNGTLSPAEVRALIVPATLLIIGAYDDEGVLLIRRPDGRPLLGSTV